MNIFSFFDLWIYKLSIFLSLKKIDRDRIDIIDLCKRLTMIKSIPSIFEKINRDQIDYVNLWKRSNVIDHKKRWILWRKFCKFFPLFYAKRSNRSCRSSIFITDLQDWFALVALYERTTMIDSIFFKINSIFRPQKMTDSIKKTDDQIPNRVFFWPRGKKYCNFFLRQGENI